VVQQVVEVALEEVGEADQLMAALQALLELVSLEAAKEQLEAALLVVEAGLELVSLEAAQEQLEVQPVVKAELEVAVALEAVLEAEQVIAPLE